MGAEDDDVVPNNRNTCSGDIGRFLLLLLMLRRDDDTLIADELLTGPLIKIEEYEINIINCLFILRFLMLLALKQKDTYEFGCG